MKQLRPSLMLQPPFRRFRRPIWGLLVLFASAATTSLCILPPVDATDTDANANANANANGRPDADTHTTNKAHSNSETILSTHDDDLRLDLDTQNLDLIDQEEVILDLDIPPTNSDNQGYTDSTFSVTNTENEGNEKLTANQFKSPTPSSEDQQSSDIQNLQRTKFEQDDDFGTNIQPDVSIDQHDQHQTEVTSLQDQVTQQTAESEVQVIVMDSNAVEDRQALDSDEILARKRDRSNVSDTPPILHEGEDDTPSLHRSTEPSSQSSDMMKLTSLETQIKLDVHQEILEAHIDNQMEATFRDNSPLHVQRSSDNIQSHDIHHSSHSSFESQKLSDEATPVETMPTDHTISQTIDDDEFDHNNIANSRLQTQDLTEHPEVEVDVDDNHTSGHLLVQTQPDLDNTFSVGQESGGHAALETRYTIGVDNQLQSHTPESAGWQSMTHDESGHISTESSANLAVAAEIEPIGSIEETKEEFEDEDKSEEYHNNLPSQVHSSEDKETDSQNIRAESSSQQAAESVMDERLPPPSTTEPQHPEHSQSFPSISNTILVNDETPPSSTTDKTAPAPEDSLASFFEKVNSKRHGSRDKHSKANPPSTSFEALASQQQQTNAILDGRDATKPRKVQELPEIPTEVYSGLPWGIVYSSSRRIPDLELLYKFFKERINADDTMARIQPEARFPLSMGMELQPDDTDALDDEDLAQLLSSRQQEIDTLLQEADTSVKNVDPFKRREEIAIGSLKGASTTNDERDLYLMMEQNDGTKDGTTTNDLIEGLDDIDKFFQSVDPPDELDVGAASGSSMQELIMGKSREILVKRVITWYRFLVRVFQTTKEKFLKQSFLSRGTSFKNNWLQEHDWNATAHSFMTIITNTIEIIVAFFDDLMDRDDDNASADGLDLDAIRKMGGLETHATGI